MICRTVIFCFVMLMLSSCGRKNSLSEVEIINSSSWQKPVTVSLYNEDTVSLRNIVFFLRSRTTCMDETLPITVTVMDPDSLYFSERFPLRISHNNHMLAQCSEIPYRRCSRLSKKGIYKFIFSPETAIIGVEAVGVKLK